MNNYKNMSNEEIKEQLEWSDQHEFSYGYSIWAFNELKQLKKQKDEIFKYIKSFEYYIPEDNKNELLRMLGEVDVED